MVWMQQSLASFDNNQDQKFWGSVAQVISSNGLPEDIQMHGEQQITCYKLYWLKYMLCGTLNFIQKDDLN